MSSSIFGLLAVNSMRNSCPYSMQQVLFLLPRRSCNREHSESAAICSESPLASLFKPATTNQARDSHWSSSRPLPDSERILFLDTLGQCSNPWNCRTKVLPPLEIGRQAKHGLRAMSADYPVLPALALGFVLIHMSLWITYIIKPFDIGGELKSSASETVNQHINHSSTQL
jgi:hypothetical protein